MRLRKELMPTTRRTYQRCSQFSMKIHLSKFKLYFYVATKREKEFKKSNCSNNYFVSSL